MLFSLKTAYRFIKHHKLQNLVIMLAVIIGVGVQFFILTMSSVLKNIIVDNFLLYTSNVRTSLVERKLNTADEDELLLQIMEFEEVDVVFYENFLNGNIRIAGENTQLHPFYLYVAEEFETTYAYREMFGIGIEETLVKGRLNDPTKMEIMLDDEYAKQIGAKLGDTLIFYGNFLGESREFILTGTYDTGRFHYKNNFTYLPRTTVVNQSYGTYFIVMSLHDPETSTAVVEKIKPLLKNQETVSDWQSSLGRIIELQRAQRAVIGTIEVLISITIFIVVLNMLNYSIQKKYREIGILKAMGLNNKSMQWVFTLQTSMVASFATIFGLFFGRLAVYYYGKWMIHPETQKPRFIYQIHLLDYLALMALMMIVAVLASFFSFRKTNKMAIIELIKY